VNEVEINVVEFELLKGSAESALNVLTLILPQLCSNKDILSLDLTSGNSLLNTITYSFLILID